MNLVERQVEQHDSFSPKNRIILGQGVRMAEVAVCVFMSESG